MPGVWDAAFQEYETSVVKAKHTDIESEILTGDETTWIQEIKADPDNPPIHVLMTGRTNAFIVQEGGLTDTLIQERVPNCADVTPSLRDSSSRLGCATNFGAAGLVYNREEIADPPKTWLDFLDRAIAGDFGKRATLPSINYASTDLMVIFNLANAMGCRSMMSARSSTS